MTKRWEDLNARARGLSTHLLGHAALLDLAAQPDMRALAAALASEGFQVGAGASTPEALELAVRRSGAERLRVLARWCGRRASVLAVIFEDEDRRSLRAMLRGAVQHAPAEARLAGLLPTPQLPERALGELAAQPTPARVAALLAAWHNPYAPSLVPVAGAAEPDLLDLELAINRTFAARATSAARGTQLLRGFVAESIDVENAVTALVLAGRTTDLVPRETFLPGGARVSIVDFERAVERGNAADAGIMLAAAFAATGLARVFERAGADLATVETAALEARINALKHVVRVQPLGPAPVLLYALRLRAETMDLQRIIWSVALGAGTDRVPPQLASA